MFFRTVWRVIVLGALALTVCAELREVLWSRTAGASSQTRPKKQSPVVLAALAHFRWCHYPIQSGGRRFGVVVGLERD
jgi:hypothetical protein